MLKLLKIQTEVNGISVVSYGKCFLEYPKKENELYLLYQAEVIVSKLIGIDKFKLNESNYSWSYENYNEKKHSSLNIMNLDDVYEPVFSHSFKKCE
ncbi:hypothetical protein [Tenacibaculum dicentrarchi]|uniref:hypothetical protein n=1 Tax=Tenacibaculum dicentrarchi TaxID=669041 RepID=UPI000C7E73E5|nr:hypothetical protein TDCHD05_70131 [Tenacibaculum dicentrarchi]